MKITNKKSRRNAARARAVLAQHKAENPELEAFDGPVNESADRVIVTYDGLLAMEQARRKAKAEKEAAARALLVVTRKWVALASMWVPSFDGIELPGSADVMDDVTSAADAFIGTVKGYESAGVALPTSELLHAEIGSALEVAKLAWEAGIKLDGDIARQRLELREACVLFNRVMISFRRTLAITIGTTHPDYRRLRTAPNGAKDDEEVEVEEVEGENGVTPPAIEEAVAQN